MNKITQEEFNKEFRPKDPSNYSKSELAEPLFEAMNTLMNQVEAFIEANFKDKRDDTRPVLVRALKETKECPSLWIDVKEIMRFHDFYEDRLQGLTAVSPLSKEL